MGKQSTLRRTYDPPGLATQEQVEGSLDEAGIDTESFNASLLQEPWETKNGFGNPFQVFTLLEKVPFHHLP